MHVALEVAPNTVDHVATLHVKQMALDVAKLLAEDDHVPALQLIQERLEVAPLVEDHVPTRQLLHCRDVVAPANWDQVPLLQLIHDD